MWAPTIHFKPTAIGYCSWHQGFFGVRLTSASAFSSRRNVNLSRMIRKMQVWKLSIFLICSQLTECRVCHFHWQTNQISSSISFTSRIFFLDIAIPNQRTYPFPATTIGANPSNRLCACPRYSAHFWFLVKRLPSSNSHRASSDPKEITRTQKGNRRKWRKIRPAVWNHDFIASVKSQRSFAVGKRLQE